VRAAFGSGVRRRSRRWRRIQRQRARGDSLGEIAADLNASEVPTAQGGVQWYAATVRHVLLRTS
jgi:hypothetical protein